MEAQTKQKSRPKHFVHGLTEIDSTLQERLIQKIHTVFSVNDSTKRILFVANPEISPEHFVYKTAKDRVYPCFPPYGIGLLTRIIEHQGYTADLIDLHYELLISVQNSKEEEDFGFYNFLIPLLAKIKDFRPDVISLSSMFNMGHPNLKVISETIKKNFPEMPIIAGGVHPTLSAEAVLADVPEIDFILMHEGDTNLNNFLKLANGDNNTELLASVATHLNEDTHVYSKRLASAPLDFCPDYKNLPIEQYSQAGRIGAYTFLRPPEARAASVLSRKGCRAQCSFCSVRSVNGSGVQVKDAELVAEEFEKLNKDYGISHVMWLDDDLFYDDEKSIATLRAIADKNLGMTWDASNGIIAAALHPELLDVCVESGCVGFNIGIESGNPEILKQMRKPGTVEKFRSSAKLLLDYPTIFTKGFLLIGYPEETLLQITDTMNLAIEMQLDWYPSQILTPLPGTPVHQIMLNQDMLNGIPSEVLAKGRTYAIGSTGVIRKREQAEKTQAKPFTDHFKGDLNRVPTREELPDIWLAMDYKINYEPIVSMTDLEKINKKKIMLQEIYERMTDDNPLGALFYSLCLFKTGEIEEGERVLSIAESYLNASQFWQLRFEALGVYEVLESLQKPLIDSLCITSYNEASTQGLDTTLEEVSVALDKFKSSL